jgi:sugar/nucleoside kinase (ribokinase family)
MAPSWPSRHMRANAPAPESADVVCLGLLVADAIARPVDAVPERGTLGFADEIALRPGGCALVAAIVLARLGLRVAVVGKVGADDLGDVLVGALRREGVDTRGVLVDPEVPTSATVVLVGSDGERTFIHVPGANGRVRAEDVDMQLLRSARAVHVGGSGLMDALDGEPLAAILVEAQASGVVTSLDTVWDPAGRWERVRATLPHLDLFTPNLAEARAVSGCEELAAIASWARERGARAVAVTMGEQGCYAAGETFEGLLAAPIVDVVDGTGAGDAFSAGFLYGELAGWPLERAARFANACGALATTAVGAADAVSGLEAVLALGRLP